MVLNGDILEYENVGPMDVEGTQGGIDYAAIDLLINFFEFAAVQMSHTLVMRLNGGGTGTKRKFWERLKSSADSVEKTYKNLRTSAIAGIQSVRQGIDYIRSGNDFFRNLGVEYSPDVVASLGATASSLERLQNMFENSPQRVFPGLESVRIGPMTVPTGALPWRDSGGDELPLVPYVESGTHIDISNIQMPTTGGGVLALKNSLTKRLRTHCYYNMSNLLWTKNTTADNKTYRNHQTEKGSGPHLYMSYDVNMTANTRYVNFNSPEGWDQGMEPHSASDETINKGVGWKNTVYVFAADWPFLIMNHDVLTQDSATAQYGRYLSWEYVGYAQTTESNPPIQLGNFITNRDWQYITHYKTEYTFDLCNISLRPYFVEIMFFKFKADPSAMNYLRQVTAVSRRQTDKVQQWIYGINEEPADIKIVHRKRILLGPVNVTNYWKNGNVNTGNTSTFVNTAMYKFSLKRQYVIKRPILTGNAQTISEKDFFQTYYQPESGIYCRIQAFTLDQTHAIAVGDFSTKYYTDEDSLNRPSTEKDGQSYDGKGVSCKMEKVSYFKLDENIYKSYASA